ncbi:hypothetical protein RCH06_001862 [Polaromonas sp. CG_9.5]|uniref:DUF3168 domain-containing protein n=1 Tax=Polaromonas sp. CG_9.5 TaxID=3071705 RepID=UPI002E007CD9|nr:hypothetical protein [Polaromonas sp. CG_9.5]
MSVQTDFVALVSGAVAGRAYPAGTASTVTPYITYSRITAIEQATLDANGGTGNLINTRLQIDVWAASYGAAQSTAAAVKAALKGWSNENIVLSEEDGFEPDTKLHRVMLDTSIWHL